MLRQMIWRQAGVALVVLLGVWGIGTEGRAQFRSAETASRLDTLRSLAPAPLSESASLDGYVRDANPLRPVRVRPDNADRYDPTLSGGQKVLLGTIGLVVQSFCDTDELKPMTVRPDFALEPGGGRACTAIGWRTARGMRCGGGFPRPRRNTRCYREASVVGDGSVPSSLVPVNQR
jgi:hypothetical protein